MDKDILKIVRKADGTIDVATFDKMSLADLYKVMIDFSAIVSQLMLQDVDEVKAYKFAKNIKEDLSKAVDRGYNSSQYFKKEVK